MARPYKIYLHRNTERIIATNRGAQWLIDALRSW